MIKKISEFAQELPYVGPLFDPKDKIAVIRMAGVIADTAMMRKAGISAQKFSKVIDKTFEMSGLKAVALVINSPGGSPAQCALISAQIQRLSQDKDIPVFAFVEDVAASGGYWLACCGDEIYAQKSSIVGSIGVISAGFGLDDFIKRYDIKRRVHTAGREKSFLDPFKAETADDVARLKGIQKNIHDDFKDWVKSRRTDLKGPDEELMEGAFWTAREAQDKGLVDGIGDVKTVMLDKFGEDVKFVNCTPEKSFLSQLPFSGADARQDIVYDVINAVEERVHWTRFGF